MKYSFSVKHSGKFYILVFLYCAVILVFVGYLFYSALKYGGDILYIIDGLWQLPFIAFPITLAVIIVPLTMLRKKKIPKSIEIDTVNSIINITYFNKFNPYKSELKEISYQIISSIFYTILILNHKEVATRGHILHFELFSLISFDISASWRKKQVYEIINVLKELNIEECQSTEQKSIVTYLLK